MPCRAVSLATPRVSGYRSVSARSMCCSLCRAPRVWTRVRTRLGGLCLDEHRPLSHVVCAGEIRCERFSTNSSGGCGRPLRGCPHRRVPGRTGSPAFPSSPQHGPAVPARACLPAVWRRAVSASWTISLTALPSPLRGSGASGRRPSRSFIPRPRSPGHVQQSQVERRSRGAPPGPPSARRGQPSTGAGRSKESRASSGQGHHVRCDGSCLRPIASQWGPGRAART
jgi:hypothetical protein